LKQAVTRLRSPYQRWRVDIRVGEPVSAVERGTFALASPCQRSRVGFRVGEPVSARERDTFALASPYQRWHVGFSPWRTPVSPEACDFRPAGL